MFGIGWSEFVVIALVLLIFVGPKHLPSVLKKVGTVVGELKRASRELQHQVTEEVRDIERSMGDLKSPKTYIRDIVDDIGGNLKELKDPYAEIRLSEKSFQDELREIKSHINDPALTAKTDTDKSAGAPALNGDAEDNDIDKGNPT